MRGNDHIGEHRTYGAAVVERLAGLTVPALLKPAAKAFGKAHGGYEAGCVKADAAKGRRDAALAAVGEADVRLDAALESLADALVGAGLSKRTSPFAGFSKYTPSKLEGLAYSDEAREVLLLCVKINNAEPPAAVKAAALTCRGLATKVREALAAISQPQQGYAAALAARDALLPEWTRALTKLQKYAGAAWADAPGVAESLFAPVEAVQAPVKRKAKKKDPKPAPTP